MDNGQMRVSVFHENLHNALYSQRTSVDGTTVSAISNVDQVRTTGLTLAVQHTDVGLAGLDMNGSLTYARARICAMPSPPPPRAMSTQACLTGEPPGWHLSRLRQAGLDPGGSVQRQPVQPTRQSRHEPQHLHLQQSLPGVGHTRDLDRSPRHQGGRRHRQPEQRNLLRLPPNAPTHGACGVAGQFLKGLKSPRLNQSRCQSL